MLKNVTKLRLEYLNAVVQVEDSQPRIHSLSRLSARKLSASVGT